MDRANLGVLGQVQNVFCTVIMIVLALYLFAAFVRAVKGPRVADRLVAVNMMGTMVMVIIATLSLVLQEDFLLDICLIYAMVSFLAVVVMTKVYMGIYEGKIHRKAVVEHGMAELEAEKAEEGMPPQTPVQKKRNKGRKRSRK